MRATRRQPVSWQWLEEQLVKTIRRARPSPQMRSQFLDLLDKAPYRTVHSGEGRPKSMARQSR